MIVIQQGRQIQMPQDPHGIHRVMERVMSGVGRLLDHIHRLYQRVLAALFHDLLAERPLNVIRLRQTMTFDFMNGYI